ncbi:helix-turn-helix domain-containing protein [Actinotalea sp.]|uniref:helix-turn-helix domain-containing protein n=1 Tax=Actinotalea sp. TaxID=1872145 RepID=UPI003566B271
MSSKIPKGTRVTGERRSDLAKDLVDRYSRGESIRALAQDVGRSYGFVHALLIESGVPMRSRGGATRGAAAEKRRAELAAGT